MNIGEIKIEKADYKKSENSLEVFAASKDILNPEEIAELVRKIKDGFANKYFIKLFVKYEIDETADTAAILEAYKPLFIYRLNEYIKLSGLIEAGNDFVCAKADETGYVINTSCGVFKDYFENNMIADKLKAAAKFEIGLEITCAVNYEAKEVSADEFINLSFDDIRSKTVAKKPKEIVHAENKPSKAKTRIADETLEIGLIKSEKENVCVSGKIISIETKEIISKKSGKESILYTFVLESGMEAIYCKKFLDKSEDFFKKGSSVKVLGDAKIDPFIKALCINVKKITDFPAVIKKDLYSKKRAELHTHTNMSANDALPTSKELLETVKNFGYPAVCVCDHGAVQAFPELMEDSEKLGIKVIYGCEFSVIDNMEKHIDVDYDLEFDSSFVVFDIETTGLSSSNDKIIEIGAVKVENLKIKDTFSQLIYPGLPIPKKITELTGITDADVSGKPEIEEVLPRFLKFCEKSVLVAHNADFDVGFIRINAQRLNLDFDFSYVDTLILSRLLMTSLRNHKLDTIANALNISLENHHRAVDDATCTGEIFLKFIDMLKQKNIENLTQVNYKLSLGDIRKLKPSNMTVIAKNQAGIKSIYEMVSISHTDYLYRYPLLPKSILQSKRENLLIGSSGALGDIFEAYLSNKSLNHIEELMNFYDYIELMPAENSNHLIGKKVKSLDDIRNIYKKIAALAEKLGKLVVIVSDAHYIDKEDKIYRKIIKAATKIKEEHPEDDLYFRTTQELFEEFSYLPKEKAEEYIIDNTLKINEMTAQGLKPVPDGKFPPVIEGADKQLRQICYDKAKELYGENLPELVKNRLEKELNSIINNGYAVLYVIAQKLVKKSNDDGYIVGSRGSVGSSLAATMSNITEVNPLPPHYRCPVCKYYDFDVDKKYATGPDLPDKKCPNCGAELVKDGFDIPFEVFLGFEGDKEPDIDLNFAGEYQSTAHKFVQDIFGEKNVFRAGTISDIKDNTAYGYVKKYEEETGEVFSPAMEEVLKKGITGVKRTTGQHPGGVIVVPDDKEITDFTPVQHPANNKKSGIITTHFTYEAIKGRILKLDILGHDGPSMLKQLQMLTHTEDLDIKLDDKKTMSLFTSTQALGCDLDDIDCKVGTLGIPEFGTKFVRQMLMDTLPTTFGELVRIAGLSHGTNVWVNNAKDLVLENKITLKEAICTRDDIMNYLISKGLEPKLAFTIMEKVRKGKGLTDEHIEEMKANNVPEWYIDSCQKIKYMFPKAHASAYVKLSFQMAYYKVYYPEAFYATIFTTKIADFDIGAVNAGIEAVLGRMDAIKAMGKTATNKDLGMYTVLELAYEMHKRNIKMTNVDLYKSRKDHFYLNENKEIIPPLMAVPGLGDVAAENIVNEARKSKFLSIEDFKRRTGATKTVVEKFEENGLFENMTRTNQLTFDMMMHG